MHTTQHNNVARALFTQSSIINDSFLASKIPEIGVPKTFLMESKNSSNSNGGDGQQQLRRSARIRKLNKMANDDDKPAGGEVQPEPEECSSSKKNCKEDRNHLDLEIVQLPQKNALRRIADKTEEQAELPKRIKIDLPLENWVDIFELLPRRQLVELLFQTDDRKFAKCIHFFLNKCGKITIEDELHIKSSKNVSSTALITKMKQKWLLADVPMPMPNNIKDFHTIRISHVDESAIDFLKEFQRNSLLTNVNIAFHPWNSSDWMLPFLTKVVPLFTSINCIDIYGHVWNSKIRLLFEKEEYRESATPMLASARILWAAYEYGLSDDFFLRWIYTPRDDGLPRVLHVQIRSDEDNDAIPLLIERIKKDFLESNSAISFFFEVYFHWVGHTNNIQFQTIENKQTNEKLAISGDHWRRSMCSNHVFIERYPIEATWKWINEMKKRGMTKYRHIYAGESRNYCCWQPDVV